MAYEITDKLEGTTEVLTEQAAEKKYGVVAFTEMVADIHPRYSADNLSIEADQDEFSEDFYDAVGGW